LGIDSGLREDFVVKLKAIATACVVASLMLGRAEPVMADNSGLVGGIIGGIIGGAIVNEGNKNRAKSSTNYKPRTQTSTMSSAQRESNREVQTSLNYFGFPVGMPDGSIGPKSRAAISAYQATMGYPATGQLSEFERDLLVSSYYRAQSGGATTAQMIAGNPMGVRGLLIAFRDERFGVPATDERYLTAGNQGGLPLAVAGAGLAALPVPTVQVVVPTPTLVAPAPVLALPNFMAEATAQVSLASQCNKVSLLTNTNGGYTTGDGMQDASFALSEQFCLARTYAMAQGEDLAGRVPGVTPAQIAEQCQAFGPVLASQVAALSLKPRDEVLQETSAFVVSSGMAPAQLAATSRICLGVGYTTDKMDVATGSALLLTALGERGYAELLGHHLSQGVGVAKRTDLALAWYETGLEAETAVFAPGLPDRTALIRKAAYVVSGKLDMQTGGSTQVLPVFAPSAPAAPAPNP